MEKWLLYVLNTRYMKSAQGKYSYCNLGVGQNFFSSPFGSAETPCCKIAPPLKLGNVDKKCCRKLDVVVLNCQFHYQKIFQLFLMNKPLIANTISCYEKG